MHVLSFTLSGCCVKQLFRDASARVLDLPAFANFAAAADTAVHLAICGLLEFRGEPCDLGHNSAASVQPESCLLGPLQAAGAVYGLQYYVL